MAEALHSRQTVPLGRHPIHRFEYADATDRQNNSPTPTGKPMTYSGPMTDADIGSVARQLDDDSFWILASAAPDVWVAMIAGSVSGGSARGHVDGLVPAWTAGDTLSISAGITRSDDDTHDIDATAGMPVDITTSGAGGLDTGAPATTAWYASWVIDDSTGTNSPVGLLSLSGTSPTLPGGYDVKRLVGWHKRHAGSWLKWDVFDENRSRTFWYDVARASAPQRLVSGGSALSWATVDASAVLPPVECQAILLGQVLVTGVGAWARPNGHTDTTGLQFFRPQNTDQVQLRIADQNLQYQNQGFGGSLTLDCQGFTILI